MSSLIQSIMTQKNQSLVFNKFLRNYRDALTKIEVGESLSPLKLHQFLGYLGYVDQYVNEQSLELCRTIIFLLSSFKNEKIRKGNLFEFLRIISDIRKFPMHQFQEKDKPLVNSNDQQLQEPLVCLKIGCFDSHGSWIVSLSEENSIRNVFGFMNLKRISRQYIDAEQKKTTSFFQQQTFHPQVLNKSKQLALNKYTKLSLNNSSVQKRLIQSQSLQKKKLENQLRKSVQKQIKQCPFKPKINKKSRSIMNSSFCRFVESLDNSFQTKENKASISQKHDSSCQFKNSKFDDPSESLLGPSNTSKVGDQLFNKGKYYQQRLNRMTDKSIQMKKQKQMKQCTFQPKLCQKSMQNSKLRKKSRQNFMQFDKQNLIDNRNMLGVKNAEKQIERVKEGRKRRQFENKVKERGYPQNMGWDKFLKSNKKRGNEINSKAPILCIDLKIMESTKNIKVFQGQSLEQITESICVNNNVQKQFWPKVESLLRQSIQQCHLVKIENNKFYLNQ